MSPPIHERYDLASAVRCCVGETPMTGGFSLPRTAEVRPLDWDLQTQMHAHMHRLAHLHERERAHECTQTKVLAQRAHDGI